MNFILKGSQNMPTKSKSKESLSSNPTSATTQMQKFIERWYSRKINEVEASLINPATPNTYDVIPLTPNHFEQLCDYLDENGSVEGIFRISGNQSMVRALWGCLKNKTLPDLFQIANPHLVACALKLWVRESGPLIHPADYLKMVNAVEADDEEKLKLALTPYNQSLFHCLIELLSNLLKYHDQTKMNAVNFGVVWGPSTLRDPSQDELAAMKDVPTINKMIQICVDKYQKLFPAYKRKSEKISPSLPQLSEKDLSDIFSLAEIWTYDKGGIALQTGQSNSHYFRVRKGTFSVRFNDIVVSQLFPLDFFGEISLLNPGTPVTADIISEEDGGELFAVPVSALAKLFATDSQLATKFYIKLAIDLAVKWRMTDLASISTRNSNSKPPIPRKVPATPKSTPPQKQAFVSDLKKNFEQVKLKSWGTLTMTSVDLTHQTKMLGFKSKEKWNLKDISHIDSAECEVVITLQKKKTVKLTFVSQSEIEEFVNAINPYIQITCNDTSHKHKTHASLHIEEEDSPNEWEQILKLGQTKTYHQNDIIIKENEEINDNIYIVNFGIIKESRLNETHDIFTTEDAFGELSSLLTCSHFFTVSVLSPEAEVLVISMKALSNFVNHNSKAGQAFFRYLVSFLGKKLKVKNAKAKVVWGMMNWSWSPQTAEELEISEGTFVHILETVQEWTMVKNTKTGQTGYVPTDFVCLI